jgi:hypothetical protein
MNSDDRLLLSLCYSHVYYFHILKYRRAVEEMCVGTEVKQVQHQQWTREVVNVSTVYFQANSEVQELDWGAASWFGLIFEAFY